MGQFGKVVGGIGILIAIYLVVKNSAETAKIIQTISSNSIAGIQTLQGR
jgi:hypothetical protein